MRETKRRKEIKGEGIQKGREGKRKALGTDPPTPDPPTQRRPPRDARNMGGRGSQEPESHRSENGKKTNLIRNQ